MTKKIFKNPTRVSPRLKGNKIEIEEENSDEKRLKVIRGTMSSQDNGNNTVVCVTGASGYIASWLVKLLLQHGYTVKATDHDINDPKKTEHLLALDGAKERLQLFQTDLLKDGSFDAVVEGCDGVFHTPSPFFIHTDNPQEDLIDPVVKGTLNFLSSCSKVPSIKMVVLTSSVAAVMYNGSPLAPEVVVDESWFSDAEFCKETTLRLFSVVKLAKKLEKVH